MAAWLTGVVCCTAAFLIWLVLVGSSLGATGQSVVEAASAGSLSVNLRSVDLQPLVVRDTPPPSNRPTYSSEVVTAASLRARLDGPVAIAMRTASRTKFAHLGAARAAEVAREAFPTAIGRPAGRPRR